MIIHKNKIISLKYSNEYLNIVVPDDFVCTDDFLKEKTDNINKTKFEYWLYNKGFTECDRGWSFNGDSIGNKQFKSIKIPMRFTDENGDLYCKLHRIENIDEFIVDISAFKNLLNINNYPDYFENIKNGIFLPLSFNHRQIYNELTKSGILLQDSDYKISDFILLDIIKKKHYKKIVGLDPNKYNLNILSSLTKKERDIFNSYLTINKFKL